MDFLDPKKKRAHKIRLYIGYALMAFALTIGSAILFFEARGFDLDRKTGEIIQNGLVFVDAHPEQATVYVNGKEEARTDSRLTIPTGDYTFEFTRNGYRTWKRTFRLEGSQIERLNYVFLFPEKLDTSEIRPYASTPTFATQSLDRKWLLIQQPGKLSTFDILDLSNQNNPPVTTITLPEGLLATEQSSRLEPVEWSTDNRHILVQHTYKGGSEFVMIDREQPSESLNLNRHFGTPIYKVALRDKKFDKLHILDARGGTLHFADSKTKQMTDLISKVLAFKSYGENVVFYVTSQDAKKGRVNVNVRRDDKNTFKVRELPAGKTYPIDITRYDDEWFLAVGTDTDKKAYVYHEVFKAFERNRSAQLLPIAVFPMKQLDHITISANTRFISAQGGSEFAVYDAEHNRQYQYDTKLKIPAGQKARWMDGHRLTTVVNGKLTVWDYDGINIQTLVSANPAFLPFFDRDYDFLYTIASSAQTKGQSTVTKTPMRTAEDL